MSSAERLRDLLEGGYVGFTDHQVARIVAVLEPPERQELVRRVLGSVLDEKAAEIAGSRASAAAPAGPGPGEPPCGGREGAEQVPV